MKHRMRDRFYVESLINVSTQAVWGQIDSNILPKFYHTLPELERAYSAIWQPVSNYQLCCLITESMFFFLCKYFFVCIAQTQIHAGCRIPAWPTACTRFPHLLHASLVSKPQFRWLADHSIICRRTSAHLLFKTLMVGYWALTFYLLSLSAVAAVERNIRKAKHSSSNAQTTFVTVKGAVISYINIWHDANKNELY